MSEQKLNNVTALIRQTRNNIISRLEEEVCCEGGCADTYCKAIAHAIEIIKGNVDYPNTHECLYCYQVYDLEDHPTCPDCAVNTQTKGITIIKLDKEEE
jgi:hypothetical protein